MAHWSARSRFDAPPNRLSEALARARREGRAHYDLSESNPTRCGLGLAATTLAPLLADPRAEHYEPQPFGLVSTRAQLAAELTRRGFPLDASAIIMTASTSEAYGYLFKLLCDPGDSVLVPAPSYPLFDVLAQLEQVRLVPYRLAYDGEWHLDASSLAAARELRTRAVITVHPNNPTGSFLKRDELRALAGLGLPIISDEVFAEYALREHPERVESALAAAQETLVFRLGGLSKSVAAPQLKLAWTAIAGPEALVSTARARLEHIADAYLSPNTPVQLALPALLAAGGPLRERILARIRANLAELQQALGSGAASVLTVEGGWYAIVRLPALLDDEEWALTLLEQDGVVVQPGYYYDLSAGTHVVLSLITEPLCFAHGVRSLAARVEALSLG